MLGHFQVLDWDDEREVERLARRLRDWEPRLDLYRPPRQARLFEPDGTLYAVALRDGMTVTTERWERAIGRGDALIVPQALAIEIEPEVDMLAIRHDGPPPDHFRERFIQVWGFEHAPAPSVPSPIAPEGGLVEVIARDDVRFRLSYEVWDLPARASDVHHTELETVLLIALTGEPRLIASREDAPAAVRPGVVAAIGPGLSYRVEGPGRIGRLMLLTELGHEARRLQRDRTAREPLSPEYRPGPARP